MEERLTQPGDVMLLYLPLAHNYGRLLHLSAAVHRLHDRVPARPAARRGRAAARAADALPERAARVREDPRRGRREVRRGDRRAAAASSTGRSTSAAACRGSARRSSPCRARSLLQHRLADRLVYSKVKERLGGRLRVANAGGAPLSRDIAEFFHAIDILILEGYGLSEVTTAATVNRPERVQVRHGRPAAARRRAADRRRRRDPAPLEHGLRRLLPRRGGDARGARRRGLRAHGRRRPHRRGRLPRHHRPQEGHHRHRRRQERRAAEPRERAEGAPSDLAGARRRRPQAVHRRAVTLDPEADERHVDEMRAQRCRRPSTR